jgi:hypothetical protein
VTALSGGGGDRALTLRVDVASGSQSGGEPSLWDEARRRKSYFDEVSVGGEGSFSGFGSEESLVRGGTDEGLFEGSRGEGEGVEGAAADSLLDGGVGGGGGRVLFSTDG